MNNTIETKQEYYDNTQKLLEKVDLNIDEVERLFNKLVETAGDEPIYNIYLVLCLLNKLIEDNLEMEDDIKSWFVFTADRCFEIIKEEELHHTIGGIH